MTRDKNTEGIVPCYSISPGYPCQMVEYFCSDLGATCLVLMEGDNLNVPSTDDPVGRGILLLWALQLISEEIDKEADTLLHADGSPFFCPEKWTWESLSQLSPDSQQAFAKERAPFLWSILTTVAINKDRRMA